MRVSGIFRSFFRLLFAGGCVGFLALFFSPTCGGGMCGGGCCSPARRHFHRTYEAPPLSRRAAASSSSASLPTPWPAGIACLACRPLLLARLRFPSSPSLPPNLRGAAFSRRAAAPPAAAGRHRRLGRPALLALLAGHCSLPASGSPARRHFRRTYQAPPLAAARQQQQQVAADALAGRHCLPCLPAIAPWPPQVPSRCSLFALLAHRFGVVWVSADT